ncbi:DNA polymerase III subunit alpha [Bacillus sp. Marseille-P3661]|uniref:DNA polymerase III subunit alpha n=1 Tax=Bacillus sp. Marseille-P3661 TaxID=1936234 RepID=UPI000C8615AD|nr:DNA polymerase III subunit alpha [Bacillus sp. Marseille-P3661]
MKVVHLHVHSAYSLLNSTATIDDLVSAAVKKDFKALALTDENVMYGAVPFYKACKKQNIKPIIGMVLSMQAILSPVNEKNYQLILLAKSNEGYRNLLKLSTLVQTQYQSGVPIHVVQEFTKGTIAITPLTAELTQSMLHQQWDQALQLVNQLVTLFNGDFYVGVPPIHLDEHKMIVQFCKNNSIPMVVNNPIHYLEKDDALIHQCLQAIKYGKKLSEFTQEVQQESFMKEENELVRQFQSNPEALENTVKIANQCNVEIKLGDMILPKFPLPNGVSAVQYLKSLCLKGLEKRYAPSPSKIARERLEYELSIIENMQFSDYFLIVWDFMNYAHKHSIITGPGRGSAAGSLVAYVLGITNVDPLAYNLLFERFLNPERITMPDIDIDFPDIRRDELIQYVSKKYGKNHVAQIVTFGTLAARAAIRDVGRVLGMPLSDIDRWTKYIPSRPGITLNEAVKESIPLRNELQQRKDAQKLFNIARKIEGLPRHTSTHAAGVVISDAPLTDLVPLQEGNNGVLLTQYSMEILEEIGLLKMDFLGLRNLTLIENIQTLIRKEMNMVINLNDIPMNDEKTFELLGAGDTTGVFQLESTGMRKVLNKLLPTQFEDIVAVNALYRPGPMENIPLFIDRKHGKRKISYPHSDLQEILEPTYGVIVYQEQIMKIASKMAGFSLGEADLLRRAVSKKKRDVLEKERKHFVNGCLEKGYDEKVADQIYDLIVRFADYGFNRSHAVAYSIIAYWLAYLKANFPLYFMCALLSSVVGNEDKIAQYIGESRQKSIDILPPSINKSGIFFNVEEGKIRFSLVPIKNVGMTAIKEILYQRRQKRFTDLFDFCARVSLKIVNRRVIESLILSGCFDEFGRDRAELLASIDAAVSYAELVKEDDGGFFLSDDIVPKPQYLKVEALTTQDKLQFEKEVLGFYLSNHPIEPYKHLLVRMNASTIATLSTKVGSVVQLGALIVNQRTIKTKKGDQMAFLTLSDETGELDAVVFPLVFSKFLSFIKKGEIIFIDGKVEERDGQIQLIVNNLTAITKLKANIFEKLYLRVEETRNDMGKLHQIKAILKKYPGPTEVYIHYADKQKTVRLPQEWSVKISEECLKKLRLVLGMKNVVIKK